MSGSVPAATSLPQPGSLQGLLPANVNLLQPQSGYFRLWDALALLNQGGATTTLQAQLAALAQQVATEAAQQGAEDASLQGQINAINATLTSLQNQINTIVGRINAYGIP